ncbi:MAG: DNA-3-methyladenine glycosylase 2 family protein [Williamsia sp.]|nr:DNA-3-methyladenine glycosylase 2 family protein [Williamsia sp.]
MITRFHADNYIALCDELAAQDPSLGQIIQQYGHPPLWSRAAGFATLVHIILEQQVSLASAMAAYTKLVEKCGQVSPQAVLLLSDADLKSCYFSRQKIVYVRSLAEAFVSGRIKPESFEERTGEEIRMILKQVKGVGDWTVDVYLIFALHHADIFPAGDLAVINAFKLLKGLPVHTSRESIIQTAEAWKPYRSIAAFLLWHYYIKRRNIRLLPGMYAVTDAVPKTEELLPGGSSSSL